MLTHRMIRTRLRKVVSRTSALLAGAALINPAALSSVETSQVSVNKIEYRGWKDCIEITNARVRMVVVPQIGRILFYSLLGHDNLLWENPRLYGKALPGDPQAFWAGDPAWNNFGGDKVWPTPQDLFEPINGRAWPPDPWMDGAGYEVDLLADGVVMRSPVSPFCGARLTRTIRLESEGTRVSIRQVMEKIQPGYRKDLEPIPLTIWSVTQIPNPERVVFPVAPQSSIPGGIHVFPFQPRAIESVSIEAGLARFIPSLKFAQKIGSDSDGWLAAWTRTLTFIQLFRRVPQARYPDNGCSLEIFSNPQYTELELLSPMRRLLPGESLEHNIHWIIQEPGGAAPAADGLDLLQEWIARQRP